ncbi:MAG: TM2 domain-containing protein [Clostridia bacterium]|nr:TM2 domain-containing protein [Clostridia bacterium]
MKCKCCGAEFDGGAYCPVCGANNKAYKEEKKEEVHEEKVFVENVEVNQEEVEANKKAYNKIKRSKTVAGILGILLGGIGAQKFYLNRIGAGILSILFCWTGIPALVGLIEGLIILVEDNKPFEEKYDVINADEVQE